MEKYLNQTKGFLGVIQSILDEKELKESSDAAQEMYEAIRDIVEKRNMNIRETLHAVLALNATILSLTLEQMEDKQFEGEKE